MKKTLYSLWYDYQAQISQHIDNPDDERRLLQSEVARLGDQLLDTFSSEQRELFNAFEDAELSLCSASEREAFIRGVSFAVSFLVESVWGD
ncbi:MAG: hypothetical protein IJC15_02405 [Clostridia bacterium]|nr:hypothetical protein [Clostridia bacterium]